MKKKIESKIKSANIWKIITIISALLIVITFVLSVIIKSEITKILLGFAGVLTLVSVITYFGFRCNILKCIKILEKSVLIFHQ